MTSSKIQNMYFIKGEAKRMQKAGEITEQDATRLIEAADRQISKIQMDAELSLHRQLEQERSHKCIDPSKIRTLTYVTTLEENEAITGVTVAQQIEAAGEFPILRK